MKATRFLAAGLFVVGSVAYAADAADPTVKARQELMGVNITNVKILGDMAGGKTAFDATAAETAKAALVAASAEIGAKFETPAEDPKSKAKPEIWTNWDDFVAKAGALNKAATALDVTSAETIGAGMSAIGGACQSCHKAYQIPG
ncbi:MAG: cytochrome c [Pseudomonadota bacterium]